MEEFETLLKQYFGNKNQFNELLDFFADKNNFEDGMFISIDSKYGMGKKYFSKMIRSGLEKRISNGEKNFVITEYNLKTFDSSDYQSMLFHVLLRGINQSRTHDFENFYKEICNDIAELVIGSTSQNTIINPIQRFISMYHKYHIYHTNGELYTENTEFNAYMSSFNTVKQKIENNLKDKYLLLFIENADICDEQYLFNTLVFLKDLFHDIHISYGVLVFADNEYLIDIYKKKYSNEHKGLDLLRSQFKKNIIIPAPDYKKAINFFYNNVNKSNDLYNRLKEEEIFSYLNLLIDHFKPRIKILKDYLENLFKVYRDNELIKTSHANIICNILYFVAIKYFSYDDYRMMLYENKNMSDRLIYCTDYLIPFFSSKSILESNSVHLLFDENGFHEVIDLCDIKEVSFSKEKDFMKIEYLDHRTKYYYINKKSTIDYIIPYCKFNSLKETVQLSFSEYYAEFSSYV